VLSLYKLEKYIVNMVRQDIY